jgi:hypothetical protein
MKTLSPRKANVTYWLCRLKRDNKDSGEASILVSEKHVSIWNDEKSGYISIPKKNFNQLIDWYNREQKLRKS